MSHPTDQFKPGVRVEVVQQIPQRDEVWTTRTRGTVLKYDQVKTGSWYAHAKDDKLWLDRLTLRLDDGEIIELNLDNYSHVEIVENGAAASE
ncbi:MAG: hypothetical protein WD294_00420 [Phycisphaeraceae bacterium]